MKLQHQIGGHPTVTADESGTLVIKPASPREIAFYQLLHSTPSPPRSSVIPQPTEDPSEVSLIKRELLLGHLKQFLPRFYGTLVVQHAGMGQGGQAGDVEPDPAPECIILSNLSVPYQHPCIMDIKLGTVLYDAADPAVTAEKVKKMEEKMRVRSSVRVGAAVTGFQTWDVEEERFILSDRETCAKLKPEELACAFAQFTPLPSPTPAHRPALLRTLHALARTLESLHALLSHLEIRFIGASLLIIYEGDPRGLAGAWEAVDVGVGRGDGLDEEVVVGDEDEDDGEGEEEDVFGKFGADRSGSQGFGLLDGSPPPISRPLAQGRPDAVVNHDHADDEERFPDDDGPDRLPRPFTLRLIDFAHTRLAEGEGPDRGVLMGLRTVLELVRGRIGEIERGGEVQGE